MVVQDIWEGIKLKMLITLAILAALMLGSVALGSGDAEVSVAGTHAPDAEIIGSLTEGSNSSASAGITITMYAADDESDPHTDTATVSLRARTAADD